MSQHQAVTTFVRHVVLYDNSDERCKPQKRIAQVQLHKRFVHWCASMMTLLIVLAIVGVGGLFAIADLLTGYPKKLPRLQDARQLVTRRQESDLGRPDSTTLPGNYRGSDDHESLQGAAEVSG